MTRRELLSSLTMALGLALLVSALAAWVLPAATPLFRGVVPAPGPVLPSVYRVARTPNAMAFTARHGRGAVPKLACATLMFDATTYIIGDPQGLRVARMDMHSFPFGVTAATISLGHGGSPEGDGAPARYAYLLESVGIATGAFMLWIHRAHELTERPLLLFGLLAPWAALFALACATTLLLVDGTRGRAVAAGLLFWPGLLGAAVAGPTSPFMAVLPWLAAGVALRAWHRPRQRLVAVVAVFVIVSLLLHLVINLVLAGALFATGAVRVQAPMSEIERYGQGFAATVQFEADRTLTPWAAALPTWSEVCPPYRQAVEGGAR